MIRILYFGDTWCQPCKALKPILAEVKKARKDVEIEPILVSEEPDRANAYGVLGIPCLIFEKDGEIKDRTSGIRSKEDILDILENL